MVPLKMGSAYSLILVVFIVYIELVGQILYLPLLWKGKAMEEANLLMVFLSQYGA